MIYLNPHAPSCPWYEITESVGAPNLKWCEETLCQWISEPANTWSNLGYLIAGIYIIVVSLKSKYNYNLKQFGPIIFFMGGMSFFYHLSNFYGSQILDFVGMFFFVGWSIGMNLIRLRLLKSKNLIWFNLGYCAFMGAVMHTMYLTGHKYQMLILISGFAIIFTEILARKIAKINYNWFFTTILFLLVAFGFSIADGQRLWCTPTNHGWFEQGHAIWHWVASFAMVTIFFHYAQPALKPQE